LGFFDFFKKPTSEKKMTQFITLNDGTTIKTNPGIVDFYSNDIIRSCVHTYATHASKLFPSHIRKDSNGAVIKTNSNLEYILRNQPNKYMNKVDFLYKVITRLILDGDSFIHINYLGSGNYEFLPLNFVNVEMLEYNSELFLKFYFHRGTNVILPYTEVIHLRRNFSTSDFFGSKPSMDTLITCQATHDTGLVNNITNSNVIRGVLEHSGMLKDSDLKAQKEAFVKDYLTTTNSGSIAAVDSKFKFTQINSMPMVVDDKLANYLSNRIYKAFNLSEEIVSNKYNEDTWNAFYESCIEPIAEQLSLELSNKLFTEREKGFKNEIIFTANKMEFTSLSTKITMAEKLMQLFTINEMREVFNREPIEGGDTRLQSLNFVDSNKANEYQLNKKEETKDTTIVKEEEVVKSEINKDSGNGIEST